MKLFTATFGTETNTFAPLPTNLASFRQLVYLPGAAIAAMPAEKVSGTIRALHLLKESDGVEPVFGPVAYAQPGGPTLKSAYETIRDEILEELRTALPVDGVALHLHGAMIAEDYLDCEGDLLARVRDLVGPHVAIGALLDPHCHLTPEMTGNADVIICYKEYPHVDIDARAAELAKLVLDCANGRIRPQFSTFDCRLVAFFYTMEEPVCSLLGKVREIEQQDADILSISIVHGFAWGDTPAMGTQILVITDDHATKGARLAEEIGLELIGMRQVVRDKMVSAEEAIAQALTSPNRPVVIADCADNPGGGAPSDSTHLIRAALDAGAKSLAAALIWDPVAAALARQAGVGARLAMRIGGKTSALCGDPIDLTVTVTHLADDIVERFAGTDWHAGESATVSADGIDLVLATNRIQCFSPDAFRQAGIDPASKEVLIVKSTQHFYAAFKDIAGEIIYADTPGVVSSCIEDLPYRHIARPKWPFDADLFVSGAHSQELAS